MRALVIDDSKAIRAILGKMLRDMGYEVAEAEDGQMALEVLKKEAPLDIALVDWNMPQMNGYDFVKAVRAMREYDELRLMMVTTENEISKMIEALDAGADEYVMKPFTKEIIVEKLRLIGMELV
ncbi:MAG: response regulator [Armatimonadetes bacterium]|nr:response regulator [Armatimonadota bacterium]